MLILLRCHSLLEQHDRPREHRHPVYLDPRRHDHLGRDGFVSPVCLLVVLTDSACPGPNGPLPREILDMYPDAPLIKREGEVDAWDNEEFRAAIKATGKTQVILAGIVTEACKCRPV